jgi:hypothetical protein
MSSSATNPLTGAGYQPDGEGAQQDNTVPNDSKPADNQEPEGGDQQQQAPDQGADKEGEKQPGNPLTALVQERQANRDQSATIAAMRAEIDALKSQQPQQQQAPEEWKNPYDPTEQPVDHMRAELEHTQAEVKQLRADGAAEIQQTQGAQALQQFENTVANELAVEGQAKPVVLAAYGFVHNNVTQMLKGQGLTGKRLTDAVRNNMLQGFVNGQTNGKTHVQTVAEMALNMGFNPEPSQQAAAKEDPTKRGQKASNQSLGHTAGGGGSTTPPTAQELAKMSKNDLKKDGGAGIKRIREILQGNVPVE